MKSSKQEQRSKFEASIIVPAFNEAEAIGEVVGDLKRLYPQYELIVVDDGSTDGTAARIDTAGCQVIRHKTNRGYGGSWKTGARAARGELICFMDGDGQFYPEDMGRLLKTLKKNGADMVSGARGKGSYSPLIRMPGKFLLKRLAEFLAGEKIADLNCGLRVFKRSVFLRYIHLFPDGFSASTTSMLVLLKRKYSVDFVPVKVGKRIGKSSARQLVDGFGVLMLMIRLVALFDPLRIFLPAAIVLTLISTVYSIYETVERGLGIPVFGAVLFIGGLLCFLLGIICDQIAALRLERFEYPPTAISSERDESD
ncbi:MAG: glycosyltransferase family 2 protein [Gemmatimonadota bacterium]|nr:glycosyltransferase family 2 protein [Gemmatimonadota bacterium]